MQISSNYYQCCLLINSHVLICTKKEFSPCQMCIYQTDRIHLRYVDYIYNLLNVTQLLPSLHHYKLNNNYAGFSYGDFY